MSTVKVTAPLLALESVTSVLAAPLSEPTVMLLPLRSSVPALMARPPLPRLWPGPQYDRSLADRRAAAVGIDVVAAKDKRAGAFLRQAARATDGRADTDTRLAVAQIQGAAAGPERYGSDTTGQVELIGPQQRAAVEIQRGGRAKAGFRRNPQDAAVDVDRPHEARHHGGVAQVESSGSLLGEAPRANEGAGEVACGRLVEHERRAAGNADIIAREARRRALQRAVGDGHGRR